MDTMKDTKMPPAKDAVIEELRMLAEDLYVHGYNRYSSAMSKAADELGALERYRTAYNEWVDKTEWIQADTTLPAKYLGMHRADVLKDMLSELEERCAAAVKMIERLEKMEAALRDHHKNAMCEGCDHSHPLTQLRLSAYQQSKLYADTVSVLERLN